MFLTWGCECMLLLLLCVFRFGVNHVYCWHGLPAYWGGIMPGAPALGPAGQTGKLVYPKPTASIAEVEPSLLWSPAVLAGEAMKQSK
jgi:raffinose synthase